MDFPQLSTARLQLRKLTIEDAKAITALCNNPKIAYQTYNLPYPYKEEFVSERLSFIEEGWTTGSRYVWLLTDLVSGQIIGEMGLHVNKESNSAEMGYWIGELFWNLGYASEAMQAILEYGFRELNLNKIYASHFGDNPASGRVMEKCGMRKEGVLRKHVSSRTGIKDLVYYGLLKSDLMFPSLFIRKGTVEDAPLLHALGKKTFVDTFGGTCTKEDMDAVVASFFGLEQCVLDLAEERDNFFFAEMNGEALGYIRINHMHPPPIPDLESIPCIELVRLYVLSEYHGKGVADQLMGFAIDFAKRGGFQKMYLSVWEYNFRAQGFYKKWGFVDTGIENDFPLGSTPQTDYWYIRDI